MKTRVKKQINSIILIVLIGVAFVAQATAEVSYHLVRFPDIRDALDVTESGVILAGDIYGDKLVLPARDVFGNPIWDSNGDGISDGYTTIQLNSGIYHEISVSSVNESLDAVGSGFDPNGNQAALLWLNAPEGNPPIDLGQTFDLRMIHASSINDLKQIVVLEHDGYFSGDPSNSWTIWALSLVNPEDTDGDGVPDQWFKDDDGDGRNDLMMNLAVKGPQFSSGCSNCSIGKINNFGEIAGMLSDSDGRGFIIVPEDIDSDGVPDLWFKDDDADGWNDLAQDLVPDISTLDISDSGRVIGTTAAWATDSYYYRWQIDSSGTVNLVTEELGAYFMTSVNDMGQAIGYTDKRFGKNDLTMTNLYDLLDNPSPKTKSLRCMDINNKGFIVGAVYDGHPDVDMFVAVPRLDNASPEVFISSPVDNATFDSGITINFSGTASDTEDGDLTGNIAWTSNIDGPIGTGGGFFTTLSDGIHTITASATDSAGATGSGSITVTVGTAGPGVSVVGITPDWMPAGGSIDVTISGTGFVAGAEV
ncbi:MAG: hypothetical protein ACYSQY_00720, partial [Planctomycetota bacterium]